MVFFIILTCTSLETILYLQKAGKIIIVINFYNNRKCQIEKLVGTHLPTQTEVSLPNENTQDISSTLKISQPSPSNSPSKTSITHDKDTQRITKDTNACSSTNLSSNEPFYALSEKLKPKVSACIHNKPKLTIKFHNHKFVIRMKILVHVFLTKRSLVIY